MATNDIRVDQVLTTIARGYSNAEFIGKNLFPVVTVKKETGIIPLFGKEAFVSYDTRRALRAESNQLEPGVVGSTTYQTEEHDIEGRIDYREAEESELDQYTRLVNQCSGAIALGAEKAAASLAFNLDSFDTANKTTLTDDFLDEAAIDPVEYYHDTVKAGLRAVIGKDPNEVTIGAKVWEKWIRHPKLALYLSANERSVLTLDILAKLFEIDKINVGKAIWTADMESGTAFQDVWGNYMLATYNTKPQGYNRTPYEPCFGYTLQKKANPFSERFKENNGKLLVARTTDNYDIKLVGASSGFLVKNVYDPA